MVRPAAIVFGSGPITEDHHGVAQLGLSIKSPAARVIERQPGGDTKAPERLPVLPGARNHKPCPDVTWRGHHGPRECRSSDAQWAECFAPGKKGRGAHLCADCLVAFVVIAIVVECVCARCDEFSIGDVISMNQSDYCY